MEYITSRMPASVILVDLGWHMASATNGRSWSCLKYCHDAEKMHFSFSRYGILLIIFTISCSVDTNRAENVTRLHDPYFSRFCSVKLNMARGSTCRCLSLAMFKKRKKENLIGEILLVRSPNQVSFRR